MFRPFSLCPVPAPTLFSPSHRQLAAAEKADKEDEDSGNGYAGVGAAEAHGNKPSRGAQIDAEVRSFFPSPFVVLNQRTDLAVLSPFQLQKEEEELLAKKDK